MKVSANNLIVFLIALLLGVGCEKNPEEVVNPNDNQTEQPGGNPSEEEVNPLESIRSIPTALYYVTTDGKPLIVDSSNSMYDNLENNEYRDGVGKLTFKHKVYIIPWHAFENQKRLKYVLFPRDLTTIEASAFCGCENLKTITISADVEYIGQNAFKDCTSLSDITILGSAIVDDVLRIGECAFAGCEGTLTINRRSMVEKEKNVNVSPSESSLWQKDSQLDIVIGDNITKIAPYAFASCNGIKSVTLGENVTSIDGAAFWCCSNLTDVVLGDKITFIGMEAFYRCSNLKSIDVPKGVTSILYKTFYGCTSLEKVTLQEDLTTIESYAFYNCASLASLTIPESVITIEGCAFMGCEKLKSINIPQGVTTIEGQLLCDCKSLESITIPAGVTIIWECAFSNCESLVSVTIPEGVTRIGNNAFQNCRSLVSVTLPSTLSDLGGMAFYGCERLASVYCKPIVPPTSQSGMFDNNAPGRKIYVPHGSEEAYKNPSTGLWWFYTNDIVGYDF